MFLSVRFSTTSLLIVFSSLATAQVLTKTNSGFNTPEAIQVIAHANGRVPFGDLSSLSAQDVNGDGKMDLLVTGPDPTITGPDPTIITQVLTTTLLRNTGNQTFQQVVGNNSGYCLPSPANSPLPDTAPPFCMVADLNGDGLPDKIFAGEYPNPSNPSEVDYPYVKVQFATGPASFAPPIKYALGGRGAFIISLAVGDFNGDGRTDIAALRMAQKGEPPNGYGPVPLEGYVFVLYGNAQGNFTLSHSYATGIFNVVGVPNDYVDFYPDMHLASLDLNGDGKSDLMVYGQGLGGGYQSGFSILLGGSTGLTRSGGSGSNYSITKLFAADLNKDGFGDVVVQDSQEGLHVLSGGGRGSQYFGYFARDQVLQLNEYGAEVLNILAGDFNRDGRPDLAIATMWSINIFLQKPDGSFGPPRQYPATGNFLAMGDFNGDGKLDLASGGNPLSILYGDGFGSFTAPVVTTNYFPGAFLSDVSLMTGYWSNGTVVTADFNHDGKPDIATSAGSCDPNGCTNFVNVFFGSGKGWFEPAKNYPVPSGASAIAVGDVNGDGINDLVTVDAWGGNGTAPGPGTGVLLGKPDGTFAAGKSYMLGLFGVNIFLRDVNNDGKLDVVTEAGVALGKGDGTFEPAIRLPYSPDMGGCSTCQTIAVGDFNGDGKLDVLYSEQQNMHVLLGDGTGHFTEKVNLSCGTACGYSPLAVGDLNGDGKLDFVSGISSDPEGGIVTYLGKGDGTFQKLEAYSIAPSGCNTYGPWASEVTIRDLNGDGIPDLAVHSNGLLVFMGRGGGRFTSPLYFAVPSTGFGNTAFATADFNLDGTPDFAFPTQNGIARLLNTGYATWPKVSSLPPPTPFRTPSP